MIKTPARMLRPIGLSLVLAAPLAIAACTETETVEQQPPLAGAAIGGDFALVSETGETVEWSDFDGSYRTVYFGYAYCPDVCPTDNQRAMAGLRQFAQANPDLAEQIQPIFITVDPERDTPEVLAEFTDAFHPHLLGLTGTEEQIEDTARAFSVYFDRGEDAPGGGYLMNHTNVTYLFGPEGQPIATLPTDIGPEAVAEELARWVR